MIRLIKLVDAAKYSEGKTFLAFEQPELKGSSL
jgi:hypothetical protein